MLNRHFSDWVSHRRDKVEVGHSLSPLLLPRIIVSNSCESSKFPDQPKCPLKTLSSPAGNFSLNEIKIMQFLIHLFQVSLIYCITKTHLSLLLLGNGILGRFGSNLLFFFYQPVFHQPHGPASLGELWKPFLIHERQVLFRFLLKPSGYTFCERKFVRSA